MKNEVKRISKADLEAKGMQIVMETKGDLNIEGILITEAQKKCWDNILTIEIERQRKEHAQKTIEGMQKKGVKPGRLPKSNDTIAEILALRAEGYTISRIVKEMEKKGSIVSESTIKKYCKAK